MGRWYCVMCYLVTTYLARQNVIDFCACQRLVLEQSPRQRLKVSAVCLETVPRALVRLVQQILHLLRIKTRKYG